MTKYLLKRKEAPKIPVLKLKIIPSDFNEEGLLKGDFVVDLVKHTKQPLYKIMKILDQEKIKISIKEFIYAASEEHVYKPKELEDVILKAFKKTYKGLLDSPGGKRLKSQIKTEIGKAYAATSRSVN